MVRKHIYLLAASAVVITTLFCTEDQPLSGTGTTNLAAKISWAKAGQQTSPDEVDSIRITITSDDLSGSRMQTFAFGAHEGTFEALPSGITIDFTVEGLDANGFVVYSGTVTGIQISGKTQDIAILAHQVTPIPPDSLKLTATSSTRIRVEWQQWSSNETGFVVER
jgi:hypothetical protein